MSGKILQKLRSWRDDETQRRGVETYRVLSNKSLEEIAKQKPENKEELLEVHGIAEKKYERYGEEILELVDGKEEPDQDEPISVREFLRQINSTLAEHTNRVRGEVVEFSIRDNYLFFTIKDSEAEAAMQCFMWRRDYDVSDVSLEEGLEVAVEGTPEVYEANGRFTFRAQVLELVGEGALKQAYEKLKAKLKEAGLFADERKQKLPAFTQSVGLITSQQSDAYHDFLANLGNYGFSVQFYPSRVQGAKAVPDLLEALDYFADRSGIDVLVITRGGGGNLEVLQAFNNEAVVKKLADLDIPVVVGIGHEKDEPLASMAADRSVSTPTACAEVLNQPRSKLNDRIDYIEKQLIRSYQQSLYKTNQQIARLTKTLESKMKKTFLSFSKVVNTLQNGLQSVGHQLQNKRQKMNQLTEKLLSGYRDNLRAVSDRIDTYEDQLKRVDPRKRLEQGYSIISADEKIVTSIHDIAVGDDISIQVADGTIDGNVTNTKDNDNE